MLHSGIHVYRLLQYVLWKGLHAYERMYSILVYVAYERSFNSVSSKKFDI